MVSRRGIVGGLALAVVLAVPGLAAAAADVATTGSVCPTPSVIGISANPGATCVTGVGTGSVTFWLWTGTVWTQQTSSTVSGAASITTNITGCSAAVQQGVAQGQSPLPDCGGGDVVFSVQWPTGTITNPGLGFVTERWRPSKFYGPGYCQKVAIGGLGLTEVVIAGGPGQPKIPC